MAFTATDLMIDVLPSGAPAAEEEEITECGVPSNCTNQTGCTDCTNCTNCSNCTPCSNCTDCSNCTPCSNCTDCSNCTPATASAEVATSGRRELAALERQLEVVMANR